ncbi:MAG: glycine cleavage system protein GcvH [Gemmatimonadota bacterium]|uniref:glycine cleavage system protein GcvH n=1 Tax=Candidatus Palauibacter scopulicola TaxID=3056741 RepID=UPI0023907CCC|nr:glycine cleavage system protein GcvH [Candidatus Palauibacter scopulicola]MDE2662781.1 glycine cleavage system protein GcvH [Candidatus Palauibacter scopulicola]
MSDIPEDLRYTPEHEYVRETDVDGEVLIGITDYAQGELGDVVYVELPAPGEAFGQMEAFGTVEAVKTVSELFCPASGAIVEVNEALEADPGLVNSDPYGDGWMIRLALETPEDFNDLLTAEQYAALVADADEI